MKMTIRLIIISIVLSFITSCAYYNMYYNAKESYNEAEDKRRENNQVDKDLYEKSLVELSKILEFYPNSRWVDDALLMMGLCYFRQEDHYKAKRKFVELLTNYPKSELFDQAKIHLAEVEIAMKNYDEARKLIENIKTDNLDVEAYELMKLNAEMSLSIGDSSAALDLMVKASDQAEGNAEKIAIIQSSAVLADKIRDYKRSAELYRELSDLFIERDKIFSSTVSYAQALNKLGDTAQAIKILETITNNEEYAQYSLNGDISLAKFYLDIKDTLKTYAKLDEILRTNPKDKVNAPALSETAFYFGEYYFSLKKDFNSAVNMYDSSGYYDRRNDFYLKGVERKSLIRDFRSLRKKIESFPGQNDSLTAKISRIRIKTLLNADSEEEAKKTGAELKTYVEQLKSFRSSYVEDKMSLAEKAYFELDLKDTALILFKELSEEVQFPHTASKAAINLVLSDSSVYAPLEDSLLVKYPGTKGANFIRIKRGIEPVMVIEDSAKYFFNVSSQKFLDSLYSEAMYEYIDIGMKYDKSPLTPKILQAAGMIAENYIKDYTKAAEIYGVLKEKYQNTAEGRFAALKLRKDGEVVEKVQKQEEKISDTEKWYQMDRRND